MHGLLGPGLPAQSTLPTMTNAKEVNSTQSPENNVIMPLASPNSDFLKSSPQKRSVDRMEFLANCSTAVDFLTQYGYTLNP